MNRDALESSPIFDPNDGMLASAAAEFTIAFAMVEDQACLSRAYSHLDHPEVGRNDYLVPIQKHAFSASSALLWKWG